MNSDYNVAKQCPSCGEWRMKDNACNYVTCGNNYNNMMMSCNIPWCWFCCRVKGSDSDSMI